MMSRPVLWFVFVIGCSRGLKPTPAVAVRATPIETARARILPDPIQARFSIGIETAAKRFPNTGGALILDRPGRGHLAVLGPLGGPLAILQTDGTGLALAISRERQHILAAEADAVLLGNTDGVIGLDALLGVLIGDVPMDDAPIRSERLLDDGNVEVVLGGPDESALTVVLDPARGTPVSLVAHDSSGQVVLTADYEPFEPFEKAGGDPVAVPVWVPTHLTLILPTFDASASLRFKSWRVPAPDSEALDPGVFDLAPPEGFSSLPMEVAIFGLLSSLMPPPSE